MKYICALYIVLHLTVTNALAGSFPVQNYGNDFMNGFNQTQQFIQRQQQVEDAASNREYQQRRLKIEEQRLELEKAKISNEKSAPEPETKQIETNDWVQALAVFMADKPHYKDKAVFNLLLQEMDTIPLQDYPNKTLKQKIIRLEAAHFKLQEKNRITTENNKTWIAFTDSNPIFADANSKQRKYGDYLFDTEYSEKIKSGELSYSQALNKIAAETYKVIGKNKEEAPAPAVEALLPEQPRGRFIFVDDPDTK